MLKNNKNNILVKILSLVMLFTFAITIVTSAKNGNESDLLAFCNKHINGNFTTAVELFTNDTDNNIKVEGLVFDDCSFTPSQEYMLSSETVGQVFYVENVLDDDEYGWVDYETTCKKKQYEIDAVEATLFRDGTNGGFMLTVAFYGRENNGTASMLSSGSILAILVGAVVIVIAIVVTVKVSKKQGNGKKGNEEKPKSKVKNKTKKTSKINKAASKMTRKKVSKTKK